MGLYYERLRLVLRIGFRCLSRHCEVCGETPSVSFCNPHDPGGDVAFVNGIVVCKHILTPEKKAMMLKNSGVLGITYLEPSSPVVQ